MSVRVFQIKKIYGDVAEWFKAAVLKTAEGGNPSVSSNLTVSASLI
jgi:hypothetical protein